MSRARLVEPSGLRATLPLTGLWAGCVVALVGVYAVFVRTTTGQRIDAAAFEGRRLAPGRAEQAADALLGTIDVTTLVFAAITLAAVALLRRRPVDGLFAAASIAGAVLTTEILKTHVLSRPQLVGTVIYDNSFPSGHATIAMAVGVAATLVCAPAFRRQVAIAAALFAGSVGAATVALGWHRPSDVVGGYLVATGWAALSAAMAAQARDPWTSRADRGGRARGFDRRLVLAAGALLAAGYLAALAVAVFSRLGALELRLIDAAFIGAIVSVFAVAALAAAALIAALEATARRGPERSGAR